jgi:hypothetical protein
MAGPHRTSPWLICSKPVAAPVHQGLCKAAKDARRVMATHLARDERAGEA